MALREKRHADGYRPPRVRYDWLDYVYGVTVFVLTAGVGAAAVAIVVSLFLK